MLVDLEVAPDTRTPAGYIDERERGGLSAAGAQMPLEAVATELDCLADFPSVADGAVFNYNARRRWWECVDAFLKVRIRAMLDNMHVQGAPGRHESVLRDVDKLLAGRARAALERVEQDESNTTARTERHGSSEIRVCDQISENVRLAIDD
eukprot:IDg13006t1